MNDYMKEMTCQLDIKRREKIQQGVENAIQTKGVIR